jgi:FkbM family methyltransferase
MKDTLEKAKLAVARRLVSQLSAKSQTQLKQDINPVVRLDFEAVPIWLHADSKTDLTRARSCAKEPATVQWILDRMKPGDVLYDVGANVGAYSLIAAVQVQRNAKVYAFEPSFATFQQLCRNVVLNQCQDAVIPHMLALSSGTGMARFNHASLQGGTSLHTLGEAVDYKGEQFKPIYTQEMLSFSIDDLVARFGFAPPTLMKIDVDGTELDIIEGTAQLLSGSSLRSVILEICERRGLRTRILDRMLSHGFNLTAELSHGKNDIADLVFDRPAAKRSDS